LRGAHDDGPPQRGCPQASGREKHADIYIDTYDAVRRGTPVGVYHRVLTGGRVPTGDRVLTGGRVLTGDRVLAGEGAR